MLTKERSPVQIFHSRKELGDKSRGIQMQSNTRNYNESNQDLMTELRLEKVGTNQKRQAKKLLNKTPNSGLNKYGEVQTALLKEESSGASRIENYGSKSKFLKL